MKKHARNLLSTMPIDNRASALQKHGKPHAKLKDVKKEIASNVQASDSLGNFYKIDVRSGSPYEKMSKDLGAVPTSLRPGQGFTKETDPMTSGLTPKEKAKRMKDAQERPGGF